MSRFFPRKVQFVAGCVGLVGVWLLTGCITGIGGGAAATTNNTPMTPTPQIISVSPGWITQGSTQPVTLTITGTNFTKDTNVLLGKSIGSPGEFQTTYVSPTQLTATLSPAILTLPQMFSVSVDLPGSPGTVLYSNALNFFVMSSNPRSDPGLVATVSGTYGSPIPAGARNWLLQIDGSNFSLNSTIEVNGSARTSFIGGDGVHIDQVTTTDLLTSDMATAGSMEVVVISDPTIAPPAPLVVPIVAQ